MIHVYKGLVTCACDEGSTIPHVAPILINRYMELFFSEFFYKINFEAMLDFWVDSRHLNRGQYFKSDLLFSFNNEVNSVHS
jgi:hypothetical protein